MLNFLTHLKYRIDFGMNNSQKWHLLVFLFTPSLFIKGWAWGKVLRNLLHLCLQINEKLITTLPEGY